MFTIVFTVLAITALTILIPNAFGQTANITVEGEQIYDNTEVQQQQQSKQQDRTSDKEMIEVSLTEFNQILDEIKEVLT
jgi:hypothetical protein